MEMMTIRLNIGKYTSALEKLKLLAPCPTQRENSISNDSQSCLDIRKERGITDQESKLGKGRSVQSLG
jgi:hypothetical protein